MRFNCAFCGTKHKPSYIEKHVNNCKLAQLYFTADHVKMFQNSEPEPPADFPEWYDDGSEDGSEQEAFSLK